MFHDDPECLIQRRLFTSLSVSMNTKNMHLYSYSAFSNISKNVHSGNNFVIL